MKKMFICKNCGKEFIKNVYNDKEPICCSKQCSNEYRKKQIKYAEFTCLQCGKTFTRTARQIKNAKHHNQEIKFCSKKCKSDYWGRNRVLVTCPVCGKQYLQQARLAKINLCCSKECSAKNPANRLLQGKEIKLICEWCKKPFKKRLSYVRKQQKRGQPVRFCSKECFMKFKRKDIVKSHCDYCGEEISINKTRQQSGLHFCSLSCKKKYQDEHNRAKLICKFCNKEFVTTKYQAEHGRKFCSEACYKEYISQEKDTYAKIQHYLRGTKQYTVWRNAVLKNDNYMCRKCGSKDNLNVHHCNIHLHEICQKYNFHIPTILQSIEFNDVSNGESLCLKCHIDEHPNNEKLRNIYGQFMPLQVKSCEKTCNDEDGIKRGNDI